MRTFVDAENRSWSIAIDAPTIKRVRAEANGIDLMNVDGPLLEKIGTDPVLLVDLIWAVCRPQAEALSVTDEQFGRALVGDALERAADALMGGIEDFFPHGRRKVWAAAMAKGRQVQEKLEATALERIEAMDAGDVADKIAGNFSTNAPAVPVSIPAPA